MDAWTDVVGEEEDGGRLRGKKHTVNGVYRGVCDKNLIKNCGSGGGVVFTINRKTILNYTTSILTCDIHTRQRTKRILRQNGAKKVYSLDDIMTASVDGSVYNDQYGLLGSNKATEDTVNLFPITCDHVVNQIQGNITEITGKDVEVMVYGDGAFKDPVGK
ncbi:coenzyme F420-0:L-glutamate ligase, partial [Acinetobacter baumannii]|nr:coenzyme F420-0:L-glutamate ligase [Acinetobacter baumannii]